MKMKKILASVAAAALAVSAMATTAFADAAYSGSYSFSDSTWWTQDWIMGGDSGKPVSDLIGDVDPSTVTSITFTSDTTFVMGYNNTEGGWSQPSDQSSYTVSDILLESYVDDEGNTHDPAFCLCLSKGDGVEYTINWTVEAAAAAPSGDSAAEAAPAFDKTYKAVLAFADTKWAGQDWESSVDVPAYGTYTIKSSVDGYADFGVFCIDIAELGTDLGVAAGDYDMSKCKVSDLKVIVDGSEIAVDMSKVLWGDPEEKGNLRIEIYNQYGNTKDASPIDNTISGTTLEVQFTLAPVAAEAPAESTTEAPAETTTEAPAETTAAPAETTAAPAETTTEAPVETTAAPAQAAGDTNAATADKNNADTGIEGVAAVVGLAILAAGAVVIAKKRK